MKVHSHLLLTALFASTVDALGNGLIVPTLQGKVAGTLVTSTVRQFLGIPFAVAKRWEAPRLPPPRSSVFQANKFGNSCVQSLTLTNVEFLKLAGSGGTDVPESEDCLSVNVWAPTVNRKQKTAVLIWIYGGAFQFGTKKSNLASYDGQHFVADNDDITVVTFNYRLNIFGQPSAPQLLSNAKSQNFGLLDIEAAINWVHANIGFFGGDPERITIFGQSAGSTAVDAYTFSHPHDTIVKVKASFKSLESTHLPLLDNRALVIYLTNMPSLDLVTAGLGNPTFNTSAWNTVAAEVGCGTDGSAQQFACMQAVPFTQLENAVNSTGASFNLLTDNITIFADTRARAAAGNFLKVPLLGGSTAQEGDVFVVGGTPLVTEVLADILTQVTFTCPAGQIAQDRITAKVPTWRYQYQGIFPDISTRPDLRAYHASEIPLVFGTFNSVFPEISSTSTEVALSKYIQQAWVAFARNPAQGLLQFGWPMYSPSTPSLAQLGNPANATGVIFTFGELVDATCGGTALLLEFSAQLTGLLLGN